MILILISINIPDVVLDLTDIEVLDFLSGSGRNVILFGLDMSSSVHIDNSKKRHFNSLYGPTQGLEHTLIAKRLYSINFKVHNKFAL